MSWTEAEASALHDLAADRWTEDNEPVKCAGNQHTCRPRMFVHALGREFNLVLEGTGDSTIVGHARGPRALVWESTNLVGHHPELGDLRVTLEPSELHAGTLIRSRLSRSPPSTGTRTSSGYPLPAWATCGVLAPR